MNYPTLTEVENAHRLDVCTWYRHLKSPIDEAQVMINNRICERFKEVGGFTPELSKIVGWNQRN